MCVYHSLSTLPAGIVQESTLYEASQAIEYLDMVLNESLRMYPPAPWWVSMQAGAYFYCMPFTTVVHECFHLCRALRECSEDITVKGFTFPKGLEVHVPIYYLHNNPEHWPEPDKFDPNR